VAGRGRTADGRVQNGPIGSDSDRGLNPQLGTGLSQRNRPPHTNPRNPADQDRDGSPVWAVSGDLVLVATVTVDRPTDSNDQDSAGTRNFTPTLNGYFPGDRSSTR
jgi:hypothetical protein